MQAIAARSAVQLADFLDLIQVCETLVTPRNFMRGAPDESETVRAGRR
jgi:hypothetical protein